MAIMPTYSATLMETPTSTPSIVTAEQGWDSGSDEGVIAVGDTREGGFTQM